MTCSKRLSLRQFWLICIRFHRFTQLRRVKQSVLKKATDDFIHTISDETFRMRKEKNNSKLKIKKTLRASLYEKSIEMADKTNNGESSKNVRLVSQIDAVTLIFELLAKSNGDIHSVSKQSIKTYFVNEMKKKQTNEKVHSGTTNLMLEMNWDVLRFTRTPESAENLI